MTKRELIRRVSEQLEYATERDVEVAVNSLFSRISQALKLGGRVELRGFGSFSIRHRRAKEARNPRTGVSVDVPAKRVPYFSVGSELRKRVDRGRHEQHDLN